MIRILSYTKNPLSLMGEVASCCWNSNPSPKIGIDCIESGHGRVLEYADVTVEISGYSARCIREIYTAMIGVSKLQASTRYINYGEFNYIIPDSIKNNKKALDVYNYLMTYISHSYKALQDLNIPKEDIANILPLGMESKMVLKINARAILHMAELRLCNRAYWEFRNFMKELLGVLSKLDDEWAKIVSYAKPKCEVYGKCTEKNPCSKNEK
ncbi:MAG TPA: FAD-dependent thymidylate synthase [Bacilli bacterium]|nr:FAD-dependent thymidylate synthase [Bacilli bacterium]